MVLAWLVLGSAAAASPSLGAAAVVVNGARLPGPATVATPSLTLWTSAQPSAICAMNSSACTAGTGVARVQLSAQTTSATESWPAVQVAFVVETTAYDGVYDPSGPTGWEKLPSAGYDSCGKVPNQPLCEESNAVPFFEDHASSITSVIAAANPHSQVSFAMVDYAATCDFWDDGCDQAVYHVDSAQFLDGPGFVNAVSNNFKAGVLNGGYTLHDEDMEDAFLHSASISALYGVISGSGLAWSNNTHHVIIWMGSTAPRDPSYVQNYCVSPSAVIMDWGFYNCESATCEPAFAFGNGLTSPNCEGWTHSQDGNAAHSIAALAHQAPSCVGSVGGVCTIDTIDVWDTPTDPYSLGWPVDNGYSTHGGVGPGSPKVIADSESILLAGCDLAAATGGTWSGPSFFSCPNGQAGGLQYVPHGPVANPNTQNPTLLNAFRGAGFGPVLLTAAARGVGSPMFTYIPPANFAVAAAPEFAVACTTPNGPYSGCDMQPTVFRVGDRTALGWNWSSNASLNELYVGDAWHVSFNVINIGPPYGTDPVLACATALCTASGEGASILGQYSWAHYMLPNTTSVVTTSFPLATVIVTLNGLPPFGLTPPPVPPTPPAFPIVVAPGTNPVLVLTPATVGQFIPNVSLQAMGAGLLMAGITRVMMKNRPIAMQVSVKNGPAQSMFEKSQRTGPQMGRFE